MKLSRYSTEVLVNNGKYLLYNTFSRNYYEYALEQREELQKLLKTLNKSEYTLNEIQLIKELMQKEIIVDDDIDELKKIEYLENASFYQNSAFHITIFATNACNFRCTYCTQDHIVKDIEDQVIDKIIEIIEAVSSRYKQLQISWFGGEPLLQYSKMCYLLKKASEICERNMCQFDTDITTNGYLLDKQMIDELKTLHLQSLQITVDSNSKIHDKRRILVNGKPTYKKIVENICVALQNEIKVILRMNVDKENLQQPIEVLEDIPREYRKLVAVSVSNIFQNEEKYSSYFIYRKAIEMGYLYSERKNNYHGCWTCGNNTLVVNTNGDILFCTNIHGEDDIIGNIEEKGTVRYRNKAHYNQKLMMSVRNNKKCMECIELPLCIGRCRLKLEKNNNTCLGKNNDGLTLEERAKLDYLHDKMQLLEVKSYE